MFPPPSLPPLSPPWVRAHPGEGGCGSHPAVVLGRGGILTKEGGGSGQPPGWLGAEICFLLVVLSREGGRTIWSPLRQPKKPGNAGQAPQIPLTGSRGLTLVSPQTPKEVGVPKLLPPQGLGTAQGLLSCRVFLPSTLLSISSPFCCPKSFSAATPRHGAGLGAWCWALCVVPGLGATPIVPLSIA